VMSEVVAGGSTAGACVMALAEGANVAKPYVLRALSGNPDCSRLISCLPDDVGEDGLRILSQVCRRTTNPWVVRHAVAWIGRAGVERLAAIRQVVEARQSETLRAALHIGTIDAAGPRYAARLADYLHPGAEREIWLMALSSKAALGLPEATACVRRNLDSNDREDRIGALEVVRFHGMMGFAEAALGAYIGDRQADVREAAREALMAMETVPEELLLRALTREGEALVMATGTCGAAWQGPGAQETHWRAIDAALDRFERALTVLRHMSPLGSLEGPSAALPYFPSTTRPLLPVSLTQRYGAQASSRLARVTTLWWGALRELYGQGAAEVRVSAMALAGRCVHALAGGTPDQRHLPDGTTWSSLVDDLRAACAELSLSQLRVCLRPASGECEELHEEAMVFARSQAVTARVIWAMSLPEDNAVGEVLKALRASQQREHRARRDAVKALGEAVVAKAEVAWAEYPLLALSHEASVLSDCLLAFSERARGTDTLVPIFAEHNAQGALLGVLAYRTGTGGVPVLLKCLSSTNALIVECAEALLARTGQEALPQVLTAFRDASDDGVRARLLEIVRCIDPAAGLSLARKALDSEGNLLAAVAARLIGQVGEASDAHAMMERRRADDDLLMGCILEAVAALDPMPHLRLLCDATASLYPFTRHVAIQALSALPEDARGDVAARLSGSPNAMQRRAGNMLVQLQGEDSVLSSVFCGAAYPAAGSYYLGARMAVSGPGPWQWGIPALMRDTHVDWRRWTELMGSDEELAGLWLEYVHYGELPSGLFWKLRDLAVADDHQATGAMELLWALLGELTTHATVACLQYHEVVIDTVDDDAIRQAFQSALRKCTLRYARRLCAPNVTASNPLGEALLVQEESYPAEDMFSVAFGYLFLRELPAALGLPGLHLPQEPKARVQATEAEWKRLMEFEDIAFGFYVAPRLTVDDLQWYCSQPDAGTPTKRMMVNCLVTMATVLPQPPDVRDAAVAALQALYLPLLRQTTTRLSRMLPRDQRDEASFTVERAFHVALGDYDPFWAQESAAYGPFGRLSDTVSGMPGAAPRSVGFAPYPSTFIPFGHFLERRLQQLLYEERVRVRDEAAEVPTDPGIVERQAEVPLLVDPADRWLLRSEGEGDDLDVGDGESEAPTPTISRRVVMVPINGTLTPCVDIETLADELGTTPDALRKREQRGHVEFARHEGQRYFPADEVENLRAMVATNADIASAIGVNRRTIERWRKETPPDLSPAGGLRYLGERAKTAPRTRGSSRPK